MFIDSDTMIFFVSSTYPLSPIAVQITNAAPNAVQITNVALSAYIILMQHPVLYRLLM